MNKFSRNARPSRVWSLSSLNSSINFCSTSLVVEELLVSESFKACASSFLFNLTLSISNIEIELLIT